MKLNGSESFISSVLFRMIKPCTALLFYFISQERHERGSGLSPCPQCIFKGGSFFSAGKRKDKETALLSDSRGRPCPFQIVTQRTQNFHIQRQTMETWTAKRSIKRNGTEVLGCVRSSGVWVFERDIERQEHDKRVDYGLLRAPVGHSCYIFISCCFPRPSLLWSSSLL